MSSFVKKTLQNKNNVNTAENNLFVSARASGSATLTHASSSNNDQNFAYIIIG